MENSTSFFEKPEVEKIIIPIGSGVPFGLSWVCNSALQIGGVYGTWGDSYDNGSLARLIESRLGSPVPDNERLNLAELGFVSRHHIPVLNREQNIEVEVAVGARILREAALACGWDPSEVEAILIGMSAPVTEDYLSQIAHAAGIPDSSLKVAVHKACDGSVSSLHLALNPDLPENLGLSQNIAEFSAREKDPGRRDRRSQPFHDTFAATRMPCSFSGTRPALSGSFPIRQ